ncbi:IS30 family transposase [Mitsuokella jalaludinii]|uniref:IS30 family transposase n=1 Tax=Mitsuokella jalaludinii TaxID=187979 RepID=UPI00307D2B45
MCHYTHLTPFEREKILFFLAEGKSITEIAHLLKRSKSTISRELRRNAAPVDQPIPDTVVGKQGKACLVTLVDRKSRYLLGGKAMSKTAAAVNKVMCEALSGQPHLSVTPDRGKEFSKHAQLSKELKRVTFYFPAPHHPWERGTNENTNGLLREFFPKGKDITDTPEDYIQRKYHELNLRPRKCLGYKTPYEVYFSKVLHLA